MSKLTRYALLGLLPLLVPAMTTAAELQDPLKKSLPPDKIQQIQAISQSVLTAKRNQPYNTEMDNLRQRADELRKAVVKLHMVALRTGKINALSLANGQAVTPYIKVQQDEQKEISLRAEAETGVRQALDRVHGQRAIVQQKVAQSAAGENHSMELNATAKMQELEDELDKTLKSPSEERAAGLLAIKEHLEVKHLSAVEADKEKTPTISTIVRHRE